LLTALRTGLAETYKLPIQLDYALIKKAVVSQLFKGEGGGAELWHDKHNCSSLKLFNPRISGEGGQIKLVNDVQAQLGTAIAGQCLPMLDWDGALETLQRPTISADRSILSIPVTKATAFDRQGRPLNINKLQDLITRVAQPKLADVKLDLKKSRGDMEKTLTGFLPKENTADVKKILDTLNFSEAEANDDGIKVELAFDAAPKPAVPKPEAPFTAAEQKQWQAIWKEWDAFLTKAIDHAAKDSQSPELKDSLMETLLESRSAFQAAIKAEHPENGDPVRIFFTNTWDRLGPQLRVLAKQLPEIDGLRYLTFIAATDVMYQLESLGAPLGLEISSDGLRKLARLLMAGKQKMEPN
jgi:hypothetical protein